MHKLIQPRYLFLFFIALSVTVYVGISLTLVPLRSDPSFLEIDEKEYYDLAGNLLQGKHEFNSRRTLGHVFVIALFRWLTFDHFRGTQWLAIFVFALTAPLMYLLVRRMTGNQFLAAIVSIFVIFWPPFLYYGVSLYSETTTLPLFVTFLLFLPRGSLLTKRSEGNWFRWLMCGGLLALCMLFRPMYLLFSPLAILIIFLEEPGRRKALQHLLLLTLGCCLAIVPWSLYMTLNAGVPILISANGGETLGGGLNPNLIKQGYQTTVTPNGRSTWFGPGKWLAPQDTGYLTQAELRLPYAQQDQILRQRTWQWIFEHPRQALYLETAKLLYMWGFYPWRLDQQTLFGSFPTIAGLMLSLASLFRFRSYLHHLSRFWLLPIFVSGVALISWGSWRFRQPGDLGILTLSLLFLLSFWLRPSQILRFERLSED